MKTILTRKMNKYFQNRWFFILLEKSDPKMVGENGIYIEPDLANNTSLDFQNASAIIDSGYVMTQRKIAEIKHKIKREVTGREMTEKKRCI